MTLTFINSQLLHLILIIWGYLIVLTELYTRILTYIDTTLQFSYFDLS